MLKRWAAWPWGIRWLVGIAAVLLALAVVWALFVPTADWPLSDNGTMVGVKEPIRASLNATGRSDVAGRWLLECL